MKLPGIVVGSGWGRHSAAAFASDGRVELVGIVGQGSTRSEQLGAHHDVPVYRDVVVAIADCAPRVAAVAVTARANSALVAELIDSSCHVLCSHPVASTADDVIALARRAKKAGVRVATDYSLRLTPPYQSAMKSADTLGDIWRVAIETPSSTLVMGVDLAVAVSGTVERVHASMRYPPQLAERMRRTPRAFAPSCLLEHFSGSVTTLTPVPHADPRSAYRLVISAERGRLEVGLPAGSVCRLSNRGGGSVERERLIDAAPERDPTAVYGEAMEAVVTQFVDRIVDGEPVHAPLEVEAHVRAIWTALLAAARGGEAVAVVADEGKP